jgi:phage terminase large subunit-like protein
LTELENAGLSAIGVTPGHDKRARMSIQSGKFESGQVYFPNDALRLWKLSFLLSRIHVTMTIDSIGQARIKCPEISGIKKA